MPVIGEFHQKFYANTSTVTTPVVTARRGMYPQWQASVITIGSIFGGLTPWLERIGAWVRAWMHLARMARDVRPEQFPVLEETCRLLSSPNFEAAQFAVRKTARTVGFNQPQQWKGLWQGLKSNPGQQENMFRHQQSLVTMREHLCSTVTNPEGHFLVELAYQDFAKRGR